GNKFAIRIRILSISLIRGAQGRPPRGATVRFQRSLFNKLEGSSQVMDGKIATMEFIYDPELKFDERDRLLNPLGFLVTDYRVDNDYGVPPAPEPAFPRPREVAAPSPQAVANGQGEAIEPVGHELPPRDDAVAPGAGTPGGLPCTGGPPASCAPQCPHRFACPSACWPHSSTMTRPSHTAY